ncbi:MAG: terminase small subunit [Paraclostridium sp.]
MKKTTPKLTLRQQKFCDFYLETGNASEAARMAGYKGKNLNNMASENLAKPYIKQYLDSRLKELESKRVASVSEIMEFYTNVLRGKETDAFGLDVGIDSRIKAAEQLGKRLGMGATSREHELKLKSLELEIKKKELEIIRLQDGDKEAKPINIVISKASDK